MYPLRFEPIFRRYLWGGRRLATELGKSIGEGVCAESWEIVDRPEANSVIANGDLAGTTLHALIGSSGEQLLGTQVYQQIHRKELPERLRGRFPLLLKFLDANKTLSVQVHPDDLAGSKKEIPDLGKTEAWYVMDAAAGSKIYCGLKSGVDREQLAEAVTQGATEQVIHAFEPKSGDCVFVPAGTVHAIGQGLLVAEIQQSSDTTYRLFDWNRVDAEGNSRDLHVAEALQVTDFENGPVSPQTIGETGEADTQALVHCEKFSIKRRSLKAASTQIRLHGGCCLLMVVEGQLRILEEPAGELLSKGSSVLIPAALETVTLDCVDEAMVLEIRIP
ncbi:MAG: class I mannose-6-phosphate isomerase [Pirellulaceae bacterium]|nr:class I mannose-6-phosphate isomerase [Pirellulaceae bacterium]MDG2103810.1 class I mannose-6-phosphate isomerase [Pirellulaceae bacterium]